MAKETLADKIAKKSLDSPEFQRNWAVHMQAFGPILENAFTEDAQSRVHLTAALNVISSDSLFYPVPVNEEKIIVFWKWFVKHEEDIRIQVEQGESKLMLSNI